MAKTLIYIAYIALCTFMVAGCGNSKQDRSTSLSITGGDKQITLKWTNMSSAKGSAAPTYHLYWSTSPGVTTKSGKMIADVPSPYTHNGLTNGVTYYYMITKVSSSVEGPISSEIGIAPKATQPPFSSSIAITSLDSAVQLNISRNETSTLSKFNLYWSNSSDSVATPISNAFGAGNSFNHTGLANGTMYYYKVQGGSQDSTVGPISNMLAATPKQDIIAVNGVKIPALTATIATPNAVTAVASNQTVTLTWNMPVKRIPTFYGYSTATPSNTPVITAYNIYWSNPLPITNILTANKISVPVTATQTLPMSFTHTGLTNNNIYYYALTAEANADASGNQLISKKDSNSLAYSSQMSGQVGATPVATTSVTPIGFTATSGAQSVTLSWTKSSDASAFYKVYNSTDILGNGSTLKAVINTNSYVATGLQNGKSYYYYITAVSNGIESEPTAVASVYLRY